MRPPGRGRGVRRRRAGLAGGSLPRGRRARACQLTLVAVIADTHLPRGARRLPDECLEWLRRADLILHAGDFVGASVLEELRAFAPVEAVRGNMDEPALEAALPERLAVPVEDVRIGLVHIPGPRTGREERLAGWFPGCAAVVYGHTHMPQLERHRDVWIVNPGSPTERRRAPGHSMALLEVDGETLQFRLIPLS